MVFSLTVFSSIERGVDQMRLLPCVMLLSFLVLESEALGQAQVPLKPHQTIPGKPFTSWSLFLVCDPAWLSRPLIPPDLQSNSGRKKNSMSREPR